MRLSVKHERAANNSNTRAEVALHEAIPWSEGEPPEERWARPARLIDVQAGSFQSAGLAFRQVASLDVLAPDELADEIVASSLREQREELLRSLNLWCKRGEVWSRFRHDAGSAQEQETLLAKLIDLAGERLRLRRRRLALHVQQVVLKDFRGFDDFTFVPSPEGSTLLIGVNGAGKSSVLDAIWRLLRQIETNGNGRSPGSMIRDDDMRNDQDFTKLSIAVRFADEPVGWSIGRSRGRSSPRDLLRQDLDAALERLRDELLTCRPVLLHYTVDRSVRAVSPKVLALDEALPEVQGDFRLFFQWFREREDIENETRIHDSAHRDPQLQAVRRAIPALIPGFDNLRVQRNPLRMLVNKGDWRLYIDQLSDGEKGLLAMTGDLARRLAMANPCADDPLLGGGVVLIDEIELHLHPRWQGRVVPALERTFPNCQFILTTHSPQVLSRVRREQIVLLSRFRRVEHLPYTEGRDSNAILDELMGVPSRPEDATAEIDALAQLLDIDDLEGAARKLAELEKRFGPDDRDVIRLGAMLHALGEGEP